MAAAFGGWVGQAVVEGLLKTVASYLEGQTQWGSNINGELKKLKAALLPIHAALENAENRELNLDENPRLGEWIWELRDALEEAEDVLDDMEYCRLERQILERDAKEKVLSTVTATSSGFKLKLSKFFKIHGCCSTSLIKYSRIKVGKRALLMDHTLNNLNAAVVSLNQVAEKLHVMNDLINKSPLRGGSGGGSSNNRINRETGHALTVDVIGQDKVKEKVLNWLTKSEVDNQESHKISALTIHGIGGVGKTTLAQSMYNNDILDFKVKMWVCVSNNNDDMVVLMQKAIASATGNPPTPNIMTNLQEELIKIVKSKKCLLVLDDVWEGQGNQSQQHWENFTGVLSQNVEKGSKILITSRMKYQVLPSKIKSDFLCMSCLNEDESLSLFYTHAFDGKNPDDYLNLKVVGEKIAKKCGGLPLALKLVGGMLNTKLDISYWHSVLRRSILNLEENMDYLKEVLKLSYQCLSSDLQACFRMCSLFPQDYNFKQDELVTLWMGLGYINQSRDEDTQPEDIGLKYLDILVKRSFFHYDYQMESYNVHDLLHDLARDVSAGECLRVEGDEAVMLPKTLRHLFVDHLNSNLMKEMCSLKKLRTLAVNYLYRKDYYSYESPYYSEINEFPKQLKSLRALFISIETMPDIIVIKELKHLRLFHMKVSILNKSLETLYKFYQLQNLKVEERVQIVSEGHDAPDGIGNLVKLRHLDLPSIVFDKITQLRHLNELQEVELHLKNDSGFKLSDLKYLNKLRCLTITSDCEITSTEAKEANLVDKKNLETLSLNLIGCDPPQNVEIYNCLQPGRESKIKNLIVKNYTSLRAPTWMTSHYLPCVTRLKLSGCNNLKYLPALGQLPALTVLELDENDGVTQLGTEFFGGEGFPSLEKLHIENMKNLKELTRNENTSWFPCLKELYITECHQLEQLPALPLRLEKLYLDSVGLVALPPINRYEWSTSYNNSQVFEVLEIKNCQNLKELPALPVSLKKMKLESVGLIALPAWQDEVSPSLEVLDIFSCEELVYVQPFLKKCVFLKEMRIENCPKILASDEFNLNQVISSTCFD